MADDNAVRITRARLYASNQHAKTNQKHGNRPYIAHLDEVVEVLQRYGATAEKDADLICAGFLHDVIEDQGVSRETLANLFGASVTDLVWAVSNEPGKNRAERHAKTYPKIRATLGATKLKLADRIANVEHCLKEQILNQRYVCLQDQTYVYIPAAPSRNNGLLEMYRKEQPKFRQALHFSDGGEVLEAMWVHLSELFEISRTIQEQS
jgi:(p)ppGpp synthase/HD superfamily hydrolase